MAEPADLLIVGAGPSAIRALVELDAALMGEPAVRPLDVVVIEPYLPGAGAVWDPDQPDHLLMNVGSGIVDFRCPSVPLSLVEWLGDEAEMYPPRNRVGGYLQWVYQRLEASPRMMLRHAQARALAVRPSAEGWAVDTREETHLARRVLLCTGHAEGSMPDHGAIAGGSADGVMIVRGAALTAFDVVAGLTIGRGGRWEGERYVASGREPERIVLASRSGEPMLPKPEHSDHQMVDAVRAQTRRLHGVPDDRWWSVMEDAVVAGAKSAGIALDPAQVAAVWRRDPAPAELTSRVRTRWSADLDRAAGRLDDDPVWWWGRTWSAGYPDVVGSLAHGPRDPVTWERFSARRRRLERWAFGPPRSTVARLAALMDAGLLAWTRDPSVPAQVDAVTPGPGVLKAPRPWDAPLGEQAIAHAPAPWPALLRAGQVTVRPGEPGILTDDSGRCLRADGSATPGLYALGRPTEGPIIDHDSLQRSLHPEPRRFAHLIAERHRTTERAHT